MTKVSGTSVTHTQGDTFEADIVLTLEDGTEYTPASTDTIRFALKSDYKDAEPILFADLHVSELEAVDRFRFELALRNEGEGLRIVRIAAFGEVENAAVADLPGFVLRRKIFGGKVTVFRNHLTGEEIDVVPEIAVFLIVEEETAAHADMREIAKAEIGDPVVRIGPQGVGQRIVHSVEHFIVGFEGLVLLKNAILVKIIVIVLHCALFRFIGVVDISGFIRGRGAKLSVGKTEYAHGGDSADKRF